VHDERVAFDAALRILEAPFVVAERSAGGYRIEGIYRDVSRLADFEPIDLVDGETVVWDGFGRLLTLRAAPRSVANSQFDDAAGEPHVEITTDPQPDVLLDRLTSYLSEVLGDVSPALGARSTLRGLLDLAESRSLVQPRM
jgi:hypothetical protein